MRAPVATGQHSEAGRKAENQDFHGLCLPVEPMLGAKGIAAALADGISSSDVSRIASETAVASFLEDYYSTPQTWSVRKSAQQVMSATNGWLHAQTRQGHRGADQGYVCGMSVLILKGATAHILHVGDARISRLRDGVLEPLTEEHRLRIGQGRHYLTRAMGLRPQLEIDYHTRSVAQGDVFMLATDGVHEYLRAEHLQQALRAHDSLDEAARALVRQALAEGSGDNLTVQLLRVDAPMAATPADLARQASTLPCPPLLSPGMTFEGFVIERELHASARSHVYLARDGQSPVAIKIPSLDQRHDPAYLERLLQEEWLARRIDSRHVARAWPQARPRQTLYIVSEYIEGRTLAHYRPGLEAALDIAEQAARGLAAFHRLDILHRDLRPENLILTPRGEVKIIDMGSAQAASRQEGLPAAPDVPGAVAYAAPEYFLGQPGSPRADLYSLGVITYQLLTGRLPYGAQTAKIRSRADLLRLRYQPAAEIPAWLDAVLAQAVHPDPARRFQDAAEFAHALRHPVSPPGPPPLAERDPLLFWKLLSLLLAFALFLSFAYR